MPSRNLTRCLLTGLTSCSLLLPTAVVAGNVPGFAKDQAADSQPATPVTDVALGDDWSTTGRVVDAEGRPLEGLQLIVYQDNQAVDQAVTNADGAFVVKPGRGGGYRLSLEGSEHHVRFWAPGTAPPVAQTELVFVAEDEEDDVVQAASEETVWDPTRSQRAQALVVISAVAAAVSIPLAVDDDDDVTAPASP